MPFNVLIASGLLSELRFEENKVEVCFENKERDEKVLFFRLKPELREYYCLEEDTAEEEIEGINNSKKVKKHVIY
jgi:hypothetical protein